MVPTGDLSGLRRKLLAGGRPGRSLAYRGHARGVLAPGRRGPLAAGGSGRGRGAHRHLGFGRGGHIGLPYRLGDQDFHRPPARHHGGDGPESDWKTRSAATSPRLRARTTRLVDLATHTSGYPRIPTQPQSTHGAAAPGPVLPGAGRRRRPGATPAQPRRTPRLRTRSNTPISATACSPGRWRRREEGRSAFCCARRCWRRSSWKTWPSETDADPDGRRLFGRDGSGTEIEHWRNPALPGAGSPVLQHPGHAPLPGRQPRPETRRLAPGAGACP